MGRSWDWYFNEFARLAVCAGWVWMVAKLTGFLP